MDWQALVLGVLVGWVSMIWVARRWLNRDGKIAEFVKALLIVIKEN